LMNGPEIGVAIPVHIAEEFLNAVAAGQPHSHFPSTPASTVKV
jgi:hypothetical protein